MYGGINMAVDRTEQEYRKQFELFMLQSMMEPDEEKRKEYRKQINNLEKQHEQARFTNSNSALEEMFAETDVISRDMDSESIFANEMSGGKVR